MRSRSPGCILILCGLFYAAGVAAAPPGAAARARLAAGESLQVVVEFDVAAVDQAAAQERTRRRLSRDDAALRTQRTQGYARIKAGVEAVMAGAGAARVRDYAGLPLAIWRVDTPAALARLQDLPGVRAVHENSLLRTNSVSHLSFIRQPEAAAEGATGAGTVVAVIDGGLGSNYLNYSDFGTCTGVNIPAATCRVRYNENYYSGPQASHETAHGTNVSAIALGVAPGAKLAMYNVFGWFYDPATQTYVSGAFLADVLDALLHVLTSYNATTYNVVAVNMSLGDGGAYTSTCAGSVFAAPIGVLADAGIATVVSAGNSGAKQGIADPACVPQAVSVGAVYSHAHTPVAWGAPASCSEAGMPDLVSCFSQSADFLTMLAPGLFVDAPDATFRKSGTSQAAPHVTGALAVLRARYPDEPVTQSVQRLRDGGVPVADSLAGGRIVPRLDLLAALHEAARLDLSVIGPTNAVSGQNGSFTLTATNSGLLIGTNLGVQLSLPAGTTVLGASAGCSVAGALVTCTHESLAPGASASFTVQVRWNYTGPVTGSAVLLADQINASSSQQVALGGAADDVSGDAPLPLWAIGLLAVAMLPALRRRDQPGLARAARSWRITGR